MAKSKEHISPELYDRIAAARKEGVKPKDIAVATGVPERIIYLIPNRMKKPGEPRADKGSTDFSDMPEFLELVKEVYLRQSRRDFAMQICVQIAKDRLISQGKILNAIHASFPTIWRWLKPMEDGMKIQWNARYNQKEFQANLPKIHGHNHWHDLRQNQFWGMDGRQSDVWCYDEETDELFKPFGYYIIDIKTRAILAAIFSKQAFNAKKVRQVVLFAANLYGLPPGGMFIDNGREQDNIDSRSFYESLHTPEALAEFRTGGNEYTWGFIEPVNSPFHNSMANIPTDFVKPITERVFGVIQRYGDALFSHYGYAGSTRATATGRSLRRSPRKQDAVPWKTFLGNMCGFIESREIGPDGIRPYHMLEMPEALKEVKKLGLSPTPHNAIECTRAERVSLPISEECLRAAMYHHYDRFEGKSVNEMGSIQFKHKGEILTYYCNEINFRWPKYEKVDLALDPVDESFAHVYRSSDRKYIGVAECPILRKRRGEITTEQLKSHVRGFRNKKRREVTEANKKVVNRPLNFPTEEIKEYDSQPLRLPIHPVVNDDIEINLNDLPLEYRQILEATDRSFTTPSI
ncbi:MAG: hypothetical protein M5R41_10450 [Bacteroidia bacterium]|nr:hypothetical protein [Bacteroidia bacterium]